MERSRGGGENKEEKPSFFYVPRLKRCGDPIYQAGLGEQQHEEGEKKKQNEGPPLKMAGPAL